MSVVAMTKLGMVQKSEDQIVGKKEFNKLNNKIITFIRSLHLAGCRTFFKLWLASILKKACKNMQYFPTLYNNSQQRLIIDNLFFADSRNPTRFVFAICLNYILLL